MLTTLKEYSIRFFSDYRKITLNEHDLFPLEFSEIEIKFWIKRKFILIRSLFLFLFAFIYLMYEIFSIQVTTNENILINTQIAINSLTFCTHVIAILNFKEVKKSMQKSVIVWCFQFIINLWPLYTNIDFTNYLLAAYNLLPNLLLIQMIIMQTTYLYNNYCPIATEDIKQKLRYIVIGLTIVYIPIFLYITGIVFKIQMMKDLKTETYIFYIGFILSYVTFLFYNMYKLDFCQEKILLLISTLALLIITCIENDIKLSTLFVNYIIRYVYFSPIIRDVVLYVSLFM